MLIYEKNNKLNINFDNEVNEQPDLQISKEDGKTSVTIDGQESGGGSGGTLFVTWDDESGTLDKTWNQIHSAMFSDTPVIVKKQIREDVEWYQIARCYQLSGNGYYVDVYLGRKSLDGDSIDTFQFISSTPDGVLALRKI